MNGKIRFWWEIASNVWWCLIFGWLVVILSYINKWEFPSSGAVLSCCVIVAELLFNQRQFYEGLEKSTKADLPLYLPAFYRRKIREISNNSGEKPWEVAKRIHNRVDQLMAFSIVCGTVIWGYGHLWI